MALRFNIENETNLPDGGPVSFTVTGKRIVDIGRDRHLDWTLPDPARLISGKHCEVHYRDGGYWLHDVSTNGTFLNGADQRMRGPHRLRNGDRFIVGHYIIGVAMDSVEGQSVGAEAESAAGRPKRADYAEIWKGEGDAPPPVDRQQLKVPREAARPVNPEFLDWAASVPDPDARPARRAVSPETIRTRLIWAGQMVRGPLPRCRRHRPPRLRPGGRSGRTTSRPGPTTGRPDRDRSRPVRPFRISHLRDSER